MSEMPTEPHDIIPQEDEAKESASSNESTDEVDYSKVSLSAKDDTLISPVKQKSDSTKISEEESSEEIPIKELEEMKISEKSPAKLDSIKLKTKPSPDQVQSKTVILTPAKRTRSKTLADVYESPYNTRLKTKMMIEKEKRSQSACDSERASVSKD